LSLLHTLLEQVIAAAVALDLRDGQVNEHTGDLGALGTNNLGDEVEDSCADNALVVGVDLVDGGVDGHCLRVEINRVGVVGGSNVGLSRDLLLVRLHHRLRHSHVGHRLRHRLGHWLLSDIALATLVHHDVVLLVAVVVVVLVWTTIVLEITVVLVSSLVLLVEVVLHRGLGLAAVAHRMTRLVTFLHSVHQKAQNT